MLPDGKMLSWSADKTLRLWSQAGKPLAILEGHTGGVDGALALPDGRILSWSGWQGDKTLRLWDLAGRPLAVLEGHTEDINGALELPDGRILSWSDDKTLRLWNRAGNPLAVLKGHTDNVWEGLWLAIGRIISWARDKTLRIWDKDGKPLVVYELDEGLSFYPEAKRLFYGAACVLGNTYLTNENNSAILSDDKLTIVWHGASECLSRRLNPDGRALVTQANGQVCILQPYHGHRPITLDDL